MNPPDGFKRGFVRTMEAWYWQPSVTDGEEFMVGLYADESGTAGEFAIRWKDLGKWGSSPRLEVFNDAWSVLPHFQDVLARLAECDAENITPSELHALLIECGLIDLTKREHPDSPARVPAWKGPR